MFSFKVTQLSSLYVFRCHRFPYGILPRKNKKDFVKVATVLEFFIFIFYLQNTLQGTKMEIPCEKSGLDVRNISNMPAPKKLVTSSADRMMPPPPPKNMPPPPPPTFTPKMPTVEALDNSISLKKSMSDSVPDTLIKLMEYGTDDDDTEEEISEEISKSSSTVSTGPKPFWAI